MTYRVGSLFAGIGGFDLAAQWVGWRTGAGGGPLTASAPR